MWHEFYRDLFERLQCKADMFIVERPKELDLKLTRSCNQIIGILLPSDPAQVHGRWIQMINNLSKSQYRIAVRYHPIFSDSLKTWKRIMPGNIELVDPNRQSVAEFLSLVDAVIGYPSTVIVECALNGKPAICMRNEELDKIKGYHFIFSHPDVVIAEIEDLNSDYLNRTLKTFMCK